jgi:Fe-S oxidoreductase
MLDFATCTECGRCQSQCPAWNTGKPLSPKLVIMDLRDHMLAKAPYMIGGKDRPEEGSIDFSAGFTDDSYHGVPESGFERVRGSGPEQAARPLVGTLAQGGVIDPDVLWSCTTCGACVEQCPVDIEHVDHIVDMRRHQVLIESEFPSELGVLFKNLENKGNPWGQNAKDRLDWTKNLDFEVPVFGADGAGELSTDTEYLFWIGCAGAFDDNAKKTVRATAELLHRAGVEYVVLGPEETCTGDPARRSGNEFLFQMLAQQNVEVLNAVFEGREPGTRKIVTTCPHCLNTLGREYPQLDGHYEVVHHTQLLNKLVREGRLVPVAAPAEDAKAPVTYHDPCYLGRHNEVYSEPRELIGAVATLTEMPRHADRSMCCGAGGRGCGWRSGSGSGSTSTAPRRPWPPWARCAGGGRAERHRRDGADQRRERGAGRRRRHHRRRLPVLQDHAVRRPHPEAGRGRRRRRGDPRRVADAAGGRQARRPGHQRPRERLLRQRLLRTRGEAEGQGAGRGRRAGLTAPRTGGRSAALRTGPRRSAGLSRGRSRRGSRCRRGGGDLRTTTWPRSGPPRVGPAHTVRQPLVTQVFPAATVLASSSS